VPRKVAHLRLSDQEREQLEQAASIRGITLSEFLRLSALTLAGVVQAELELGIALQAQRRAKEKEKPEPAELHVTTSWQTFEEYRRDRPATPLRVW
jgi:hypothetical protein